VFSTHLIVIYFSHKDFCRSIEKIVLYMFRLLIVSFMQKVWVFRINKLITYYKAVLDIKIHSPFDQELRTINCQ